MFSVNNFEVQSAFEKDCVSKNVFQQ